MYIVDWVTQGDPLDDSCSLHIFACCAPLVEPVALDKPAKLQKGCSALRFFWTISVSELALRKNQDCTPVLGDKMR